MQESGEINKKFSPKAKFGYFFLGTVLKILVNVTLKVKDKDEQCNYITRQESEWQKAMNKRTRIRCEKVDAKTSFFQDWRIATMKSASL